MYKRLLKDASLYSISSVVARGFSFITVPVYTRILSPADYGALDLLSYLAVLTPLLVGAALDQAVARFYVLAADDVERRRIASTVLIYISTVFLLFVPFAGSVANYISVDWLDGQVDMPTALLVLLQIWVNTIYYYVNNQLKYMFLSKQYALCNIGNTVVSIVSGFIFVVYADMGLFGIFLGQVIGQGIFALLSFYFGRYAYSLAFQWRTLKKLLSYSIPLVPGTMAFFAMQYVDRYALNQLSGLHDVGIYGIGARIASLLNLFLMGFQGAWDPIVMKHHADHNAPERFARIFSFYLFGVLTILIALSLFGSEILYIFTTRSFSDAYMVVPLLVLAAILASIGNYFTFGISIARKSQYRMILNLIALAINVILNYTLIPEFGIVGASMATVLSFVFLVIAGMFLSQRYYYVPYSYYRIAMAMVVAVAASSAVLVFGVEISAMIFVIKCGLIALTMLVISKCLHVPLDLASMRRAFLRDDGVNDNYK